MSMFPRGNGIISKGLVDRIISLYAETRDSELVCAELKKLQRELQHAHLQLRQKEFNDVREELETLTCLEDGILQEFDERYSAQDLNTSSSSSSHSRKRRQPDEDEQDFGFSVSSPLKKHKKHKK